MAILAAVLSFFVLLKGIYDTKDSNFRGSNVTGSQQAIIISGIGDQPKKNEELTEDELKRLLNMIESAGDVEEGSQVDN